MGCNCGKKRMAQYSSNQLNRQASGETIVASTTEMSTVTGQAESNVDAGTTPRVSIEQSVVR